jgi:hypothetical protein
MSDREQDRDEHEDDRAAVRKKKVNQTRFEKRALKTSSQNIYNIL